MSILRAAGHPILCHQGWRSTIMLARRAGVGLGGGGGVRHRRGLYNGTWARQASTSTSTATDTSTGENEKNADDDPPMMARLTVPPPVTGPRPEINIKHIRDNAELHEQNCLDRNYRSLAGHPARIRDLHFRWCQLQKSTVEMRKKIKSLQHQLGREGYMDEERKTLVARAREMKRSLSGDEEEEARITAEMEDLALALPNLTSPSTPRGGEGFLICHINDHPNPNALRYDPVGPSHVEIGAKLGILDFASAATSSGWGWYYLVGTGSQLELALIQFALSVARKHGWKQVTPPSMVYGHIASACGFQPRDQNDETQIYALARSDADKEKGKPEMVMAGTAEIPLAAMRARSIIVGGLLPLKHVGVSRCYRAEAGARGMETKGLYRVHEFNKVEMFAWSHPTDEKSTSVLDDMVNVQKEILKTLGLHCRIMEMPSADLGASATRKIDIEAYFPSRRRKNHGWGEVTSASSCTDYQTRRLKTRAKINGSVKWPWTLNGTALAVPRILAAVLEYGWDADKQCVMLPQCLWEAMGTEKIRAPIR